MLSCHPRMGTEHSVLEDGIPIIIIILETLERYDLWRVVAVALRKMDENAQ